jgi:redox-sensitive bicupin YhaK (pirin superfamily)
VQCVDPACQAAYQIEIDTRSAGVHLRRAFGFGDTQDLDPFLFVDDFRNDVLEDDLAGFPWHPHRGIEAITHVLAGTVVHGTGWGSNDVISAGDVQWVTAAGGIIHREMQKGDRAGRMHALRTRQVVDCGPAGWAEFQNTSDFHLSRLGA